MKFSKQALSILLILALSTVALFGCSSDQGEGDAAQDADDTPFSHSKGLDENGYWEGVTATDYVEMFDYDNLTIPRDVYEITDDAVQTQVDSFLANASTPKQVTDRAVADGETVNIDYVGSVDGVEFEGGNTGGAGTEVTIGVTSYIDDFLAQLVGHMPGETFDIEVTFPDDYSTGEGLSELAGKDAVFNVTINYISEAVEPELTDAFVSENLSESYGWTTIAEMEEGIRAQLQKSAISSYVQEYFVNEVAISAVPDSLMKYQEGSLVKYYEDSAAMYGMEWEDFLSSQLNVASTEELLEANYDNNVLSAHFNLVIQAIAEDADIKVSDEDVAAYFAENYGSEDYSTYEEQYGMPYLKMVVLSQAVLDRVIENATLG